MQKNNNNVLPIIHTSSSEEKEWVTEQLIAFNREFFSIPQHDYIIPLNFHIRDDNGRIVAGINAFMLAKSTVYVSILWVDKHHRGYSYGSQLIEYVECEAKKLGAVMIHLETLDFQAREFYLKYGYEEFAVLENSPAPGRARFYMKKMLSA